MGVDQRSIPAPEIIGENAVRRLNLVGARERYAPLDIIDRARVALAKMPEGKTGIVLGSGPNTADWRNRGWKTLDIDPTVGADYTANANQTEKHIAPSSQDFILAETIVFDRRGRKGVGPGRLLQQANLALRPGGMLVIESAHVEGSPIRQVPDKQWYAQQMRKHGFRTVVELHDRNELPSEQFLDQRVFYYGVKVAEGFSEK